MVGGGGGVSGPKELMGWVDSVTDGRAYPHPAPRSAEVEELVFYNMSNVRCNLWIKENVDKRKCIKENVHQITV